MMMLIYFKYYAPYLDAHQENSDLLVWYIKIQLLYTEA
jgi:hypothetical protein